VEESGISRTLEKSVGQNAWLMTYFQYIILFPFNTEKIARSGYLAIECESCNFAVVLGIVVEEVKAPDCLPAAESATPHGTSD
jgi:hypothetical protein